MRFWSRWSGRQVFAIAAAIAAVIGFGYFFPGIPGFKSDKNNTEEKRSRAPVNDQGASALVSAQPPHPQSLEPEQPLSKAGYFKRMAEYALANGHAAVAQLKQYLLHPDWEYRCAALRALAATGSEEAKTILREYVSDERTIEESAQAALALSELPDPSITAFLIGKYRTISNLELRSCLIDTLASRPYEEVGAFFQDFLTSAATDPESKAMAIRALGFYHTSPTETLLTRVFDTDVNIREAAYDALSYRSDQNHGQVLLARLPIEADPGARQSLYGALSAQTDLSAAQLGDLAMKETASGPRIRAQQAWAKAVSRSGAKEDADSFTKLAVPELLEQALNNPDPGEQRAALQALATSRTPAAAAALETISKSSPGPRLSALASKLAEAIATK